MKFTCFLHRGASKLLSSVYPLSHHSVIYIHVPFCKSRCIYCDFYSTTQTLSLREQYVHALCQELHARRSYLPSAPIQSIYFGGGTPSQLTLPEIERILQAIHTDFEVSAEAEITFEANPDDIEAGFVRQLRALGFNRMSLGVQSFDDGLLQMLNRRHTAAKACEAVRTIVGEGIDNVSIDLIYGLPGQTLQHFQSDLDQAFRLPVKHLSSYALSVEEGTALYRKLEKGELTLPDEDLFLAEYKALMQAADAHGFRHYEISNFGLPGYESRHNSGYWLGTPYLGCGPGAHSFDGTNRRYNTANLAQYVKSAGQPSHEDEILTPEEHFNEWVMISLRTSRGLEMDSIEKRFGKSVLEQLIQTALPHIEHHLLEEKDGFLRLTREGIFVSDDVMSDFML